MLTLLCLLIALCRITAPSPTTCNSAFFFLPLTTRNQDHNGFPRLVAELDLHLLARNSSQLTEQQEEEKPMRP